MHIKIIRHITITKCRGEEEAQPLQRDFEQQLKESIRGMDRDELRIVWDGKRCYRKFRRG